MTLEYTYEDYIEDIQELFLKSKVEKIDGKQRVTGTEKIGRNTIIEFEFEAPLGKGIMKTDSWSVHIFVKGFGLLKRDVENEIPTATAKDMRGDLLVDVININLINAYDSYREVYEQVQDYLNEEMDQMISRREDEEEESIIDIDDYENLNEVKLFESLKARWKKILKW